MPNYINCATNGSIFKKKLKVSNYLLKYEDIILLFVAFTPDITAASFKRQYLSKNINCVKIISLLKPSKCSIIYKIPLLITAKNKL